MRFLFCSAVIFVGVGASATSSEYGNAPDRVALMKQLKERHAGSMNDFFYGVPAPLTRTNALAGNKKDEYFANSARDGRPAFARNDALKGPEKDVFFNSARDERPGLRRGSGIMLPEGQRLFDSV